MLRTGWPLLVVLVACSEGSLGTSEVPSPLAPPVKTTISTTADPSFDLPFVVDADTRSPTAGVRASSSWWRSTSTPGFQGTGYLVAPTASVSDAAEFWFDLPSDGCRRLEAWWTSDANRATRATFIAYDADGSEQLRVNVDQTRNGSQWVNLGEVDFSAGRASVLLSRWATTGAYVVADALRVSPCSTSPSTPTVPEISFVTPADHSAIDNPVTFTFDGQGISSIRLSADGWEMDSWDVSEGWSTTYTFSTTDVPRLVLAEGLDADGDAVAWDTLTVTPLSTGPLDVPYFEQYDNRYEPGSTCGLTSTTMVLDYWTGRSVRPDDLYVRYGKTQAQSPEGIVALLGWEGVNASYSRRGTRAELRAHLDDGHPVIVHGDWTGAGHIVVLIGYDDRDWIVHDPAGDWEVCYGCGGGEGVHYAQGGEWDRRMSYDGDIWYSVSTGARD